MTPFVDDNTRYDFSGEIAPEGGVYVAIFRRHNVTYPGRGITRPLGEDDCFALARQFRALAPSALQAEMVALMERVGFDLMLRNIGKERPAGAILPVVEEKQPAAPAAQVG